MSIKIEYREYKNNETATFWSRLESVLGVGFGPLVILGSILLGFFVTKGHKAGMVFWVIGSIAIGVAYCFLVIKICEAQIEKALFRSWMKEAKKHVELDRIIQESVEGAVLIYEKSPREIDSYMLRYIEKMNPQAAERIRRMKTN